LGILTSVLGLCIGLVSRDPKGYEPLVPHIIGLLSKVTSLFFLSLFFYFFFFLKDYHQPRVHS
jgi:hypothetical protein